MFGKKTQERNTYQCAIAVRVPGRRAPTSQSAPHTGVATGGNGNRVGDALRRLRRRSGHHDRSDIDACFLTTFVESVTWPLRLEWARCLLEQWRSRESRGASVS